MRSLHPLSFWRLRGGYVFKFPFPLPSFGQSIRSPKPVGCLAARSFAFPRFFGWRVAKEVEPGVISNRDPGRQGGWFWLGPAGAGFPRASAACYGWSSKGAMAAGGSPAAALTGMVQVEEPRGEVQGTPGPSPGPPAAAAPSEVPPTRPDSAGPEANPESGAVTAGSRGARRFLCGVVEGKKGLRTLRAGVGWLESWDNEAMPVCFLPPDHPFSRSSFVCTARPHPGIETWTSTPLCKIDEGVRIMNPMIESEIR